MENLTSDIVREILSRLPKTKPGFKSVLQCRKVCKHWQKLLGKPKTGTLITKSNDDYHGPVKIYYREHSCEMVNSNFTGEEKQNFDKVTTKIGGVGDMWSFSLVGSFNGLVCYETLGVIYVFNPITGERVCLSSDLKQRKKRKRTHTPKMDGCFNSAGFGYCHATEEYKVVKICNTQSVQVYTLGDASGWRDKPDTDYRFRKPGVFANGALYWLHEASNRHTIVAFDLADETFRCHPSPPPCHIPSYSSMAVNLGSFEGNLYLCCRYKKEGENMMDIWIQKKENNMDKFAWYELFSRKWDFRAKCQLLSLTESEILLWQGGVLSCYDPTTFKKKYGMQRVK